MAVRLGLDASQPAASCAVSTEHGIVAALAMEKAIENFPELIRKTLSLARINLNELNEIVACTGPGSQTGIRTAVVTGNALALALGIPISGVLSIDAAAAVLPAHGLHYAAVTAGRSRWYVEEYRWEEGRLYRADRLQLVDELPADISPAFGTASADSQESKLCAYGVLVVAERHRHLISQSLTDEILPYGQGE